MPPPRSIVLVLLSLFSHVADPTYLISAYTILGGIDDAASTNEPEEDDSMVTETLRHFSPPLDRIKLRIQTHEPTSGRVSMAGTLWEASPLLADYVTNPACPLEAFQRSRRLEENGRSAPTVVELGSGIGLASLAAAFTGCAVLATDGSPSSIRLLDENFARHADRCAFRPRAAMLEWGDDRAVDALIDDDDLPLRGCFPDVVMASDVVYAHSAREELHRTVRRLCPVGHRDGRVLMAHRWRADPVEEEAFFKGFDDEFEREEVPLELFTTESSYYRRRSMLDMRYPVSLFEMRRK